MADPFRHPSPAALPAPLVALCSWLVPGLGYFLIGQRARAVIAGGTIGVTFLLGILIGGIRVIDVPGYDPAGQAKMVRVAGGGTVWSLKADFRGEVLNKPWYIAQTLVGPANVLATYGSLAAAENHRMSTARVFDIGTLYTAVAGMLNLLVILDATYRSTRPFEPEFEPKGHGHDAMNDIDRQTLADAHAVAVSAQTTSDETTGGLV